MMTNLLFSQLTAIGKRFAMVLTMLLIVGVGQAWGAEGDTHNFSQTLSQLLNNNASVASIEIAEQSYAIKTVKVTSDYNKSAGGVTMEVLVAGTSWGTATHNSDETKTFTFNGISTKGKVTIIFTNNCGSGTGKGTFKVTNVQLIEGAPATPYSVKFYKTSTTFESVTETSAGAGVTPPTMEEECGDWTFQGWSESQSNSETSTTELELVTLTDGKYYPTEDVNLYPVYTKSEGGGGTEYVLTDIGEISSGDIFVFADASNYALTNNNGTSSAVGVKQITVSNSKITSTVDATIEWQLTGNNTNGYTFYPGIGTTTWLYCNTTASSSNNNNMRVGTGDRKLFVVNNDGYLVTKDTYTDRYLSRYNTQDFRGYTNTNTNPVKPKLYKKTAGSTTYYYSYPDCGTTETSYSVTSTLSHVTADGDNPINITSEDTELELSYSADTDWNLPENITITMGGNELTDSEYVWDNENGDLLIQPTSGFTGHIVVTINGWKQLDPPTGLNVRNITSTSATLSWGEVANASSYTVFITDLDDEVITLTDIEEASVDVTGLSPETLYLWDVVAIGDGANYTDSEHSSQEDPNAEFTTLNACEQLGAATELTVETNYVHTDGKIYVKFSWTPADNTKANATSQKICFGKVDEAGTCVDDLEKNLTWTGDLKSKLEPGEYWWSIQALGDGVNYCDGDVVNGTNFTIEAPIYTVEWFVNGEEAKGTPTTSVTAGQKVTDLPTTPTSADCDDNKVFVGWTDTEIDGTSANAPTNLYKELGDFPAINANTIYYAVFAEGNGAAVWQKTDIANITPSDEVVVTITRAEETYALTNDNGTSNPPNAIVLLIENDAINLSPMPDEYQWNISKDESSLIFYPKGKTDSWLYCTETNNGVRVGTNDTNRKFTIDATSGYLKNNVTSRYLGVYFNTNGEAQDWRCYTNTTGNIANQTLAFYKNTSSLTNYSTTCVTPVWETDAATIDKTSFTVNCGERSPMTGANGAAKITFPTDKIYDFTSAITIEATSGFLVSTSQSVDANYQSSVSLSPLVGTTNANTFYNKFVYVRAEAPAMSEEDLSGTITIKNNKGETLQTFSVTADVTCTQYTLTLVDRGVSTEQPTKYYAGETINETPADPEGVCTDPIHYVFDGWAEATVAAGATTYTKVTFPYTVEGNTKFYAVYRYLAGGGDGDYHLVEKALDDWSGDYLIAYSDQIFANGTIGGESGIGAKNNKVDLSSNISNNIIPATVGDQYNVTLEAVTGGYVLKTQDGKYNYHTNNTGNGISASTIGYADDYPITVKFVSQEEINLCLGGAASGSKFRYNTDGYFRFYKNGGQQPVYLYKKADGTTYYTTSPVCGPHLAITEGKDIYVTGGNAGGTRDLVIAQKKVSYKATRLEKDKSTGNLPSIKALPSNIVFDNTKTKAVAVTFDEDSVRTLQSDGTYTITGNITIAYQPAAANVTDDIQVTLNANYNPSADVSQASFTVHARSLPAEFVIVAKSGDKWYALNGDMNTNAANPANGQVTLDNVANPTKATYAPCNTIYTFDGLPNTGDRTYGRFQGTDGAWLWASSGTNVGIQNNVLKTTPEGNNNAYNWKLYTEDNITYRFGNANSNRQLTLNGEKFGMYASGVQDIRILPYDKKCLYNYAPSNLKVSVLKGTYVTLTWDAVIGATQYQYSTNGTTWTDAGTEPTVTIDDLTGDTEYTYYIRAYHEDAGVSQECIDYAEITFTTADCDDVPTDITYTADLNSITVSWTAAASTATITYNTKEDGTGGGGTINGATSPCRISGGLNPNTTYYIQILAGGTCASPIIPVKTEDVEVDIVEWMTDGIKVDINTDETVGVTLENEVSYGSGIGTEATELFFSKYYEASYNVKLVAIYNGTKNIIDLTDYTIQYGKTSWEDNYITLKDFGATKGQIQPGEEIILYSMQEGTEDDDIMDCVYEDFPDGNWVEVTSSNNDGKGTLSFGGDKTIILCKKEYDDDEDEYYDNIIDVIGALIEDPNEGLLPTNTATKEPSWGDKEGWVCETGLSIADDSPIGISTNRCLLVRNNTVTSGLDAVEQNIEGDFVTLCSEWKGAQVPDSDIDNGLAASCENFAYVGTFDYSDYYTKYESMGEGTTFEKNDRNPDGTVTIPITDLYKHACSNIRVKLTNSNGDVLTDREYKVPIMITTTQGTDGQTFLDLQQNLATKEVDGEGNVINTHPLSLEEVREICKTCDVVVRDNATLMKMADDAANDHPQVHDVFVYENSSLIVPNGTNYTINSLSLRRKGDDVASLNVYPDALKLPESSAAPITLDLRIDAQNWHWFALPYNCNISEVTWADGTPAQYNTDWFLMTYDGESRSKEQSAYENHWKQYFGTTIEEGKGYIVGITGDINNPARTYELRFPIAKEVLADEKKEKTVDVRAWGVEDDIRPNKKGWNLIGNPYLTHYQKNNVNSFGGLRLGELSGPDPQTGHWTQTGNLPYVVVPVEGGWVSYEQVLVSETDLLPFTAYFVQVGNDGEHTSEQDLKIAFDSTKLLLSTIPMPASLIRRAPSEIDEVEEPVIVGVSLTNTQGESDKTSLVIDDQFTDKYEMNADFFKWFGDYYKYYTKPVLYTIGADDDKLAFNAISEELATQPISLGMYAAQAGNYTFSLDLRSDLSKVQEVWLHDATQDTHINLLQESYTFHTAKTESAGRFFLSVKMAPKVSTEMDNVTDGTVWATTQDHTIVVNGLLSDAQLWIYDATGKLLHTDHTLYYQHSYSVPQSGTYFVRVQNTMQTQTIKVVVE